METFINVKIHMDENTSFFRLQRGQFLQGGLHVGLKKDSQSKLMLCLQEDLLLFLSIPMPQYCPGRESLLTNSFTAPHTIRNVSNNALNFGCGHLSTSYYYPTFATQFKLLAEVALAAEVTKLILRGISEGWCSQAIPLHVVKGN